MTPLAHGSGIDDALIVLLPLAIVIVMLRLGAKKMPPEDADATDDGTTDDGTTDDGTSATPAADATPGAHAAEAPDPPDARDPRGG